MLPPKNVAQRNFYMHTDFKKLEETLVYHD